MVQADPDKAVGYQYPDLPVAWLQRDILLYCSGIGAKRDELQFLYELHPDWAPFFSYPLVLPFKGNSQNIVNFEDFKNSGGPTPGMPNMPSEKSVHAEQSIEILKQIPPNSGDGWKLKKSMTGVKNTGKGVIIDTAQELVGPDGSTYARMTSSSYTFGEYGFPAKYAKSVAPKLPVKAAPKPPEREPDFIMTEKTTEEQAVIYRLSGDYNPLHIDPSIGLKLSFPGAISHGLGSYGHAARAIVLKAAGGDSKRVKFMSARFSSPVMPGQTLTTKMWASEGGKRIDFIQYADGKPCLSNGVALIASSGSSKL